MAGLPDVLEADLRTKYLRYSQRSTDGTLEMNLRGLTFFVGSCAPALGVSEMRLEALFMNACGAGASRALSRVSFPTFLRILTEVAGDVYGPSTSATDASPLLRLVLERIVPHRLEEPLFRSLLQAASPSRRSVSPNKAAVHVDNRGVHVLNTMSPQQRPNASSEVAPILTREFGFNRGGASSPAMPAAAGAAAGAAAASSPGGGLIRTISLTSQSPTATGGAPSQQSQKGDAGSLSNNPPGVAFAYEEGATPATLGAFLLSLRLEMFETPVRSLGAESIRDLLDCSIEDFKAAGMRDLHVRRLQDALARWLKDVGSDSQQQPPQQQPQHESPVTQPVSGSGGSGSPSMQPHVWGGVVASAAAGGEGEGERSPRGSGAGGGGAGQGEGEGGRQQQHLRASSSSGAAATATSSPSREGGGSLRSGDVWQEYATAEGYLYYHCASLGVTQWYKPATGRIIFIDGSSSSSSSPRASDGARGAAAAAAAAGSHSAAAMLAQREGEERVWHAQQLEEDRRATALASAAAEHVRLTEEAHRANARWEHQQLQRQQQQGGHNLAAPAPASATMGGSGQAPLLPSQRASRSAWGSVLQGGLDLTGAAAAAVGGNVSGDAHAAALAQARQWAVSETAASVGPRSSKGGGTRGGGGGGRDSSSVGGASHATSQLPSAHAKAALTQRRAAAAAIPYGPGSGPTALANSFTQKGPIVTAPMLAVSSLSRAAVYERAVALQQQREAAAAAAEEEGFLAEGGLGDGGGGVDGDSGSSVAWRIEGPAGGGAATVDGDARSVRTFRTGGGGGGGSSVGGASTYLEAHPSGPVSLVGGGRLVSLAPSQVNPRLTSSAAFATMSDAGLTASEAYADVFEAMPTMHEATQAIMARAYSVANPRRMGYADDRPDVTPTSRFGVAPEHAGERLMFTAAGADGRATANFASQLRPALYTPSKHDKVHKTGAELQREWGSPAVAPSQTVTGYAYRHAAAVSQWMGAGSVYDRLTDTRGYTGLHRYRFDSDGRGTGMRGRDNAATDMQALLDTFPVNQSTAWHLAPPQASIYTSTAVGAGKVQSTRDSRS